MSAQPFCPCGVSQSSAASRCGSCPHREIGTPDAPRAFTPAPPTRSANAGGRPDATALMTYSRWKKSTGTFGPLGRIIATGLLFVPLPLLAVAAGVGIGLVGGGIYLLVIVPWALRDIWRRAAIPVDAPAAPSMPRF